MHEFLERLREPWFFLGFGYLITISIETPILCLALSPQHPQSRRLLAGVWLTACTYPIIILVLPRFFASNDGDLIFTTTEDYQVYLLAFRPLTYFWRDMAAVFGANAASFGLGLLMNYVILQYLQQSS
jgi:hypothetical protein